MPNIRQVRLATYEVMREFGFWGTTVRRVHSQMKLKGFRPGSVRDLAPMVAEVKREQEPIGELPPEVVKLTEAFASKIWRVVLRLDQTELQGAETKKGD